MKRTLADRARLIVPGMALLLIAVTAQARGVSPYLPLQISPEIEREMAILSRRLPKIEAELAAQIARFVHALREEDLEKRPGIAETLDWTTALIALDRDALDPDVIDDTLGVILKYQDDVEKISGEQARLILDRVNVGT